MSEDNQSHEITARIAPDPKTAAPVRMPVEGSIVRRAEGGLAPAASVAIMAERYAALRQFIKEQLRADVDFGVIPGTNKKPTLLKPGAEKLQSFFGLTPTFADLKVIEDFAGGLFYYRYKCQLWRGGTAETGGYLVAEGIGSCNSHESKYRYRTAKRKCPRCGAPTISRAAENWDCLWYCVKKLDGCGARFFANDRDEIRAIESQPAGKIANPDIADALNTIDKIAQKRALIAATLIGCNASEFFTQDLDDLPPGDGGADDRRGEPEPHGEHTGGEDQRPAGEQGKDWGGAMSRGGKPRRAPARSDAKPTGSKASHYNRLAAAPAARGATGGDQPANGAPRAAAPPAGKPAGSNGNGAKPVEVAAAPPKRGEMDLRTPGGFMRAFLDICARRLDLDEKSARALLGTILARHQKPSLEDTDLDWRSSLVTSIHEGLFDRLKLKRGSEIAPPAGATPPPATTAKPPEPAKPAAAKPAPATGPAPLVAPGELPDRSIIDPPDKFLEAWRAGAIYNGWSESDGERCLAKRLRLVGKNKDKLADTRIGWRQETIAALFAKMIDPITGKTHSAATAAA